MATVLNYKKLASDISDKRIDLQTERKKKISFRSLSTEIGVNPPTMSRIMAGGKIEVDTLLLLLDWLGKELKEYTVKE